MPGISVDRQFQFFGKQKPSKSSSDTNKLVSKYRDHQDIESSHNGGTHIITSGNDCLHNTKASWQGNWEM